MDITLLNITTTPKLGLISERQSAFPRRLPGRGVYFAGDPELLATRRPAVAIVGSRRPTAYGLRFVHEFLHHLKGWDCDVVSGGALGIDAEAHQVALRLGIPTQAWLVGPVRTPSPRSHDQLFRRLSSTKGCGLFVPEVLEPSAERLLQKSWWVERNQWLVAASDVLVVVEAQLPSGTWSSVRAAETLGVPVFVLPGPIFSPQSRGTNAMVAGGAGEPIVSVEELVRRLREEFGERAGAESPEPARDPREDRLRDYFVKKISCEAGDLWEISRWTDCSLAEILGWLETRIENGEVRRTGHLFVWNGKS